MRMPLRRLRRLSPHGHRRHRDGRGGLNRVCCSHGSKLIRCASPSVQTILDDRYRPRVLRRYGQPVNSHNLVSGSRQLHRPAARGDHNLHLLVAMQTGLCHRRRPNHAGAVGQTPVLFGAEEFTTSAPQLVLPQRRGATSRDGWRATTALTLSDRPPPILIELAASLPPASSDHCGLRQTPAPRMLPTSSTVR